MADFVFNIAKGYEAYYTSLPAASDGLVVVLLKSANLEADAPLKDYDNLSLLLAGTSDECDATNYARKVITSGTTFGPPDDTNERVDLDIADQVWTALGGATNNTLGKLLICYDNDTGAGNDTNIVPISAHDFSMVTDGSDVTAA